jgi:hypothetical protein
VGSKVFGQDQQHGLFEPQQFLGALKQRKCSVFENPGTGSGSFPGHRVSKRESLGYGK